MIELIASLHVCLLAAGAASAAESAMTAATAKLELQPLVAQARRLLEATEYLGTPVSGADKRALEAAFVQADTEAAVTAIEGVLDAYCLFRVNISPESRVKVAPGAAKPVLVEKGWRQFLVRVDNEAGVTAPLRVASPNAAAVYDRREDDKPLRPGRELWLGIDLFDQQPLQRTLSGLALEYRVVQLYSRDAGKREAKVSFNVGQGTQDIGFRNDVDVLFDIEPAAEVTFRVRDEQGKPAMGLFVIRDALGRVYPYPAKRLAPDFFFHSQVYRADGEVERLPAGKYSVEYGRGPEYLTQFATLEVKGKKAAWPFDLKRWVDPAQLGWWSGDHHIHAAGCAHYSKPTKGVHAPDMMRHCLGEDLKVGCNLTWGPCFDYQKQFFTGDDDKVSRPPYLLHYDVEVSGFGSHESGHLCLLRLKEQIPPGGDSKDHWPTLCLNTLRWAKKQGAVCGPAHSGWGLEVDSQDLPNYVVPPFSGIGANEYIVDVTHEVPGPDGKRVPAVDFMSTVDTPCTWELNMWYHTLNVGFRTRVSGETDFPCIYGERVGLGRSYVKLPKQWNYSDWCEGIRQGRNYVGDGKSHLLEFTAQYGAATARMGEQQSELKLAQAGEVIVRVRAAARLNEKPDTALRKRSLTEKPYWDVERARMGESREVPVELVMNGRPVARQTLTADGTLRDLEFKVNIERSSWLAVRVLPSSHTNPIWVLVGGQPVRASRRSADWCAKGVEQCWKEKERFIRANEIEDARAAYDHARAAYRQLLAECAVD